MDALRGRPRFSFNVPKVPPEARSPGFIPPLTLDNQGEMVPWHPAGSPVVISGVQNHDDGNYGANYNLRGNPSLIQQLASGSTFVSVAALSYDSTGNLTQFADAANNVTAFSYTDNFYQDGSPAQNPPSTASSPGPTNAYLTKVTAPLIGSTNFGYYFGTGKQSFTRDPNGADTYTHYLDPLDRPTNAFLPVTNGTRGWTFETYSSAGTQKDTYVGIKDSTPSPQCTSCTHTQQISDAFGRVLQTSLVNDPDGATTTAVSYDTSGRTASRSNPYRSTSDPTYGIEAYFYDSLGRQTKITRADGSKVSAYYGANVTSAAGGAISQLCSAATYGQGFPTLTVDEAGRKRQSWADSLGRIIEVDEPNNSNGSLSVPTCYVYDVLNNLTRVIQGSQTRVNIFDGLSRLTSTTNPESGTVTFSYVTSTGGACAGDPQVPCSRTDARNITTTDNYDALSRLIKKSYSDTIPIYANGTPTVSFGYDQSNVTMGTAQFNITNSIGRLSWSAALMQSGVPSVMSGYSYDSVGNVLALNECTPSNCGGVVNSTTNPASIHGASWLSWKITRSVWMRHSPGRSIGFMSSARTLGFKNGLTTRIWSA